MRETAGHAGQHVRLSALDVDLRQLDRVDPVGIERVVERDGLAVEVGRRVPDDRSRLPPVVAVDAKCREADPAGSGGRGGPVRLHVVEPVGLDVGRQEREQTRLRLEGDHASAGADPVRGGQREVPPVRADVDEDVAGTKQPRRELRLLRLVAPGEADLARHRVALIAVVRKPAELEREAHHEGRHGEVA